MNSRTVLLKRFAVFKTAAINHSAILPLNIYYINIGVGGRSRTYGVSYVTDLQSAPFATWDTLTLAGQGALPTELLSNEKCMVHTYHALCKGLTLQNFGVNPKFK